MSNEKFLDSAQIQGEFNRITIPEPVFEHGIAETKSSLAWANDTQADNIAISQSEHGFVEDERFDLLGTSWVMVNRKTTVPEVMTIQYFGFEPGTPLYFVTTDELASERICWVGPDFDPPNQ
jgi:hypothetical protein